MKKNKPVIIVPIFFLAFAFAYDNPFYKITENDVRLNIPKGFPKPYYDFKNNKLSPEIFVLGRKLFYDNLLSKDQSISCGTCHQRIAAFAHIDHRLSHGIYAKIGKRNVPALQNLIWKDAFMWDGGVNNLEVQAINPITNPIEMDESLENVLRKLNQNSVYKSLFFQAFGDTLINSEKLLKAITQFTGLMISADSKYDRFMTHKEKFTEEEAQGFKIFRKNCATCHSEPLFSNNTYVLNGLAPDTSLMDFGRQLVTQLAVDQFKFKVPSLRNIEMTYPYMHDGRFKNLEEVLRHYATLPLKTKQSDERLGNIVLSSIDQILLLTFLKTLTDKTFLYDRRFAEPYLTNQ